MQHHIVLKVAAKLLLPFILLFALYVQFHGDFGPGGGFQAGAIFGAGIILYALVFGAGHARAVIPPGAVRATAALGVLLYTGVGAVSLLLGANFLDYDVLAADPVAGQHLGILLVELGVGLTVTAVMILLFYAFAGAEEAGSDRGAAGRTGPDRDTVEEAGPGRNAVERAGPGRVAVEGAGPGEGAARWAGPDRSAAQRAVESRDGVERVVAAPAPAVTDRGGANRIVADRIVADRTVADRTPPG